jgi:asparagine synthase (glutamine-hydrolysing)
MCGIAALFDVNTLSLSDTIDAMTDVLAHRGPDDRGVEVFPNEGVALGQRRLSIVDLAGGHQPMGNANGDVTLVFNGEIYNHAELRNELVARGHEFATHHSDTEVLVHGYVEWGTGLFARLNGMFAVVIWDRRRQEMVLARDRMGKKPMYIANVDGGYAIASELKSICSCPGFDPAIDLTSIEQYLAFDFILGPRTPFRDVKKLPGAHYAILTRDGWTSHRYWSPRYASDAMEAEDLEARLDEALDGAVARRMVADVPVGLFLSGGLDSTTVGYYMRRHSDDVHSFSIGFEETAYDESDYARIAAESLGTKHHVEILSQDRVMELVPKVADLLDEPIGDPSIFPTYLLSAFTRQHVKVALGGDGSDELLMGYNTYRPLKLAWMLDRPPILRRQVAALARHLPTEVGSKRLRGVEYGRTIDRSPIARLMALLGGFEGAARGLLNPEVRESLPDSVFTEIEATTLGQNGHGSLSAPQATVAAYVRTYLQEDILVKVDRASMATSLEVRAPFLDPAVVDLALSIPPSMRLRGFTGKYPLRQLMRGRIPDVLIDRPKHGFAAPLDSWFRGPLADLAQDHLSSDRIRAAGIFDPDAVRNVLETHMSGRRDLGKQVWMLTLFELWRERWASLPTAACP